MLTPDELRKVYAALIIARDWNASAIHAAELESDTQDVDLEEQTLIQEALEIIDRELNKE